MSEKKHIERLEAVATIIGGTTIPTRPEINAAYHELESVIEELRQPDPRVQRLVKAAKEYLELPATETRVAALMDALAEWKGEKG